MESKTLADRGVVTVEGAEARPFLHGLLTNDIEHLAPEAARYAALLSPQGKILFDMLVFSRPDGVTFDLDCGRSQAGDLARRLGFYRLRAKIAVTDRSDALGVALDPAGWADPRDPRLPHRRIAPRNDDVSGAQAWQAARIGLGVPQGGVDFTYGDAFVHEANLDLLHGIDFAKGCYVGQEVVSRVHHRGSNRKRVVPVTFEGSPPPTGTEVRAGELLLGTTGSVSGPRGLALLRVDRLADAHAAGTALLAAGVRLHAHRVNDELTAAPPRT